jgi:hypothetical protein
MARHLLIVCIVVAIVRIAAAIACVAALIVRVAVQRREAAPR